MVVKMANKYLRETTDWGSTQPNHTYILNEADRCIGYIKAGTSEELLFKKPSSQFSKKGRTFVTVKKTEISKL